MIRFKRLLSLLIIVIFSCGCGRKESKNFIDQRPKILSTIAQIGNLVEEIGGERIQSLVLVRGELNPHSYELVKGDDEKILTADLVIYNGLGLEHGASVTAMIQDHKNSFAVGDSIAKRFSEKILWKEGVQDPHIWMDISLWKESIDPITEKLIQIDPEGKDVYLSRSQLLKEKMIRTDLQIIQILQKIPSHKRFLVTSHDAFGYFTRRYLAEQGEINWQKRFAAPEGLSPEGQLNPLDLQKIIDHMYSYQIEVLFPESNVSLDSIRKIAIAGKKKGISLRVCSDALYGDSIQGSYLDSMLHNAETIHRFLGEKE